MDISEQHGTVYSRLEAMLIRPGPKTGPSRHSMNLSEDQTKTWPNFFGEVRNVSNRYFGDPRAGDALPAGPGHYIVAAESGVTSFIIQGAMEQVGRVLQAQGTRVRFGDRSTGADLVTGFYPDTIAQGALENGQTRIPGEIKCPWNTPLIAGPDRLKVLAQLVSYMDEYGCRYGFVCTHEKLIVIRRASEFRFEMSPIVNGADNADARTLSIKECLFYLAKVAEGADWRYRGQQQGRSLVDGSFKLPHNLKR